MLQILLGDRPSWGVQEPGRAVRSCINRDCEKRVRVSSRHLSSFVYPVTHQIVEDTERINLDIWNAKHSCERNGVCESLWQW